MSFLNEVLMFEEGHLITDLKYLNPEQIPVDP